MLNVSKLQAEINATVQRTRHGLSIDVNQLNGVLTL